MRDGRIPSPRRRLAALLGLAAVVAIAAGLRILIGRSWDSQGWRIEFAWPAAEVAGFRLGAVAVASTVGAALGISGLLLQTLLRNPLASPFVLGLSSGATLGLAAAMLAASTVGVGVGVGSGLGSVVPAFVGALATLAVVAVAGRRREGLDPLTLVLAGVVISSLCGALLMLVNHLLPPGTRGDLVAWTMGRIDEQPDPLLLGGTAAAVVAGLALGVVGADRLDVALLGEDEARSIGVPLGALRWAMLLGAGLRRRARSRSRGRSRSSASWRRTSVGSSRALDIGTSFRRRRWRARDSCSWRIWRGSRSTSAPADCRSGC